MITGWWLFEHLEEAVGGCLVEGMCVVKDKKEPLARVEGKGGFFKNDLYVIDGIVFFRFYPDNTVVLAFVQLCAGDAILLGKEALFVLHVRCWAEMLAQEL